MSECCHVFNDRKWTRKSFNFKNLYNCSFFRNEFFLQLKVDRKQDKHLYIDNIRYKEFYKEATIRVNKTKQLNKILIGVWWPLEMAHCGVTPQPAPNIKIWPPSKFEKQNHHIFCLNKIKLKKKNGGGGCLTPRPLKKIRPSLQNKNCSARPKLEQKVKALAWPKDEH